MYLLANKLLFPYQYAPTQDQYTSGLQPVPHPFTSQVWGLSKLGLGVGAAALIGRHRFATGQTGFDYLTAGIRTLEEYSPGRVFRTFQFGHLLSPLETASKSYRYVSPATIRALQMHESGQVYLEHLSRLIGRDVSASGISTVGFRYEGGRLLSGATGGEVLLARAGVVRSPSGASPAFQLAYARSLKGGPLSYIPPGTGPAGAALEVSAAQKAFTQKIPFTGAGGETFEEVAMFTGGQTRLQAAKRYLFGYGTSLVERLNQLARSPFELEPLATFFRKLPLINRIRFGVAPSSGLKTLGKLTAKLGGVGVLGYYAYGEVDKWVRDTSIFKGTILDEGITVAGATILTRVQKAASRIAEWTGGHALREKQEEIAPGSTSIQKLLAFPIMGVLGGIGISYAQHVGRMFDLQRQGFSATQASAASLTYEEFFRSEIYRRVPDQQVLARGEARALELVKAEAISATEGLSGRIARRIADFQARQTWSGRLAKSLGEFGPARMRRWAGIGLGLALVAPFIPGALVPDRRPEELERLYSGREYLPVRRGRWWEFGRSAYEGGRIDRYRPHWYPRLRARAKERAIWGEDTPGPLTQWWKENFTYELERRHYYDRPYPITGQAFEDVPLVGPVLAGTIGRLIKPARLMHTEEWMTGGGTEEDFRYLRQPLRFGQRSEIPTLGEQEPGAPISPYGIKAILGEQGYRFTELVGLPGFTMTAIKEAATGEEDWFSEETRLEPASRMYSPGRTFWDLEVGGALGMSELYRRLYPRERTRIDYYNPIRNTMPAWLPGPGERSEDFLHGDPFARIPEGESRLPGPGYAALNPELEGVAPEDYPAYHRFKILADIAPYSSQYDVALAQVRAAAKARQLSPEEQVGLQEILRQVREKRERKQFSPYLYRDQRLTPTAARLETAKGKPSPGLFARVFGGYWEQLAHNIETPLEYLTPVSPASKLIHMRTAVEDYERTQVYGTQNAFWGHPFRDFLIPLTTTVKHEAGLSGIPETVERKRNVEEYFDTLKYIKFTRLKRMAQAIGDYDTGQEFETARRESLAGINPFTMNFSTLFRSLPRTERDYFTAFSETRDMDERAKIYSLVPENEQALYLARWKLADATDLQQAIKKGLLSEEEQQQAEETLRGYMEEKRTEGLPSSQELWSEYVATRLQGETYPDWYRRTKLLPQRLAGRKLPGPDWVGWHPAVELNDIKLKLVENLGENAYEYDVWPDQMRAAAGRPYLQAALEEIDPLSTDDQPDIEETKKRISELLIAHRITGAQVLVSELTGGTEDTIDARIEEDRSLEIREVIRREGLV